MTVLYTIIAILLLSFLVLAHEAGHFWAAKLTRMPVKGFNIGFGPALWKHKGKDGVLYAVRIIPFGGYCAFADSDEEDAIANYYRVPVWKRMTMTLSGPLMNFLLAFVAAIVFAMASGVYMSLPVVDTVNSGSPAAAAGIQSGDRLLVVRGVEINDNVDLLREEINSSQGKPFNVLVERNGKQLILVISAQKNGDSYVIGITMKSSDVPVKLGVGKAISYSFNLMVTVVKQLLQFLFGLFTQGKGTNDVASPIGIVGSMTQQAEQYGLLSFITMGIFISVNLGLFNLLPIPGLDGSKVVFLTIEAIRRKPVPPEKEGIITAIGFGFFVLLFIFLAGRDIARLFGWVPSP